MITALNIPYFCKKKKTNNFEDKMLMYNSNC